MQTTWQKALSSNRCRKCKRVAANHGRSEGWRRGAFAAIGGGAGIGVFSNTKARIKNILGCSPLLTANQKSESALMLTSCLTDNTSSTNREPFKKCQQKCQQTPFGGG
jgi:hypothetical protein